MDNHQHAKHRIPFRVTHLLLHKLANLLQVPFYDLAREVEFLTKVTLRVVQQSPGFRNHPEALDYTSTRGDPIRFFLSENEYSFVTEIALSRGHRCRSQTLRDISNWGISVCENLTIPTGKLRELFTENNVEELSGLMREQALLKACRVQ